MKSVSQAVQDWLQAMSSSQASQSYKTGVQGVTESPMAKAATSEAMNNYINGCQQSVNSGKRAAALQAVSLAAWQNAAVTKGAPRLATGAQGATSKMTAFFTKWMPIYQQVSQTVQAMPRGGLSNAIARSSQAIQMMMQAAGKS